jgi:hypothetical protein
MVPPCPSEEAAGVTLAAARSAEADVSPALTASGSARDVFAQNCPAPLILDVLNGAACTSQASLAAAPAGLGGKFNSVTSALLAVAGVKPAGGAMLSKLVPFGSLYV